MPLWLWLVDSLAIIVVLGLLFAIGVPAYLSYRQAAVLKSGAQQLVTMINVARELALRINDTVCVKLPTPTTMSYTLGGCSGSVWIGAGTDGAGNMALPDGVTVSTATPLVPGVIDTDGRSNPPDQPDGTALAKSNVALEHELVSLLRTVTS